MVRAGELGLAAFQPKGEGFVVDRPVRPPTASAVTSIGISGYRSRSSHHASWRTAEWLLTR